MGEIIRRKVEENCFGDRCGFGSGAVKIKPRNLY